MRFVYAIKNMICILCHAFHVQSFIGCQRLILDHLAFNFWHHLQMLFKTIQYCMASFHMELTKMHWIFEAIMLVFTKKRFISTVSSKYMRKRLVATKLYSPKHSTIRDNSNNTWHFFGTFLFYDMKHCFLKSYWLLTMTQIRKQ